MWGRSVTGTRFTRFPWSCPVSVDCFHEVVAILIGLDWSIHRERQQFESGARGFGYGKSTAGSVSSISTKRNSYGLALMTLCATPAGRAYEAPASRCTSLGPVGSSSLNVPLVTGTTT